MKVVLLGDLHMGARTGDLDFARYFNLFFEDVLYPYMEKHGIDTIIQAGDYFDSQTNLVYEAWKVCKPVWVDKLVEKNYRMIVLVGNHDIVYKNTLRVNSPELILADLAPNHIQIVSTPKTIDLDGYPFDIVPWVCKENKEEIEAFIKKKAGNALIGHFAIEGFPMYKGGQVEKKGMKSELFDLYPFVFSGHFHTKSESSNIMYLGVPYQITWADWNDPKGFHVFDTNTQTVEFIENPHTMFEKFLYQEGMEVDLDNLSGKYVRLVVTDKGNTKKYAAFCDILKRIDVKDLDIAETTTDTSMVSELDVSDIDWETDSQSHMKKVVEAITTDIPKDKVFDYLVELHQKALTL